MTYQYCTVPTGAGYFPSYLLGAMMAAQLWHHCRAEHPGLDEMIAKGEFAPILGWLRAKVHDHCTVL